jgi:hypothetical protein
MGKSKIRWEGLGRILFVLAVVTFGMSQAVVAAKHDSVPDWVRSAAEQKLPAYPPETNAVVLLDDTSYSVAPNGQATEHYRRVVKILRPAGRDEGVITIRFDKDTPLSWLHVWSIGPDGHEYAVDDKEIVELDYPGGGILYEDAKYKAVRAPGRDPGGIIAYEYERKERPYLNEETWFFQEDIPHVNATFTLELPPGYTYGTVWSHHSATQATDLEHQHWRWEMKDTPGTCAASTASSRRRTRRMLF